MSKIVRIAGVDISGGRRVGHALRSIYGIGQGKSTEICGVMGLNPTSRCRDLPHTIPVITEYIEATYPNKSIMIRNESDRVLKLIRLHTYRGQRHQHCLPLNGQKKTNAQTQRRIGMLRAKLFGFPLIKSRGTASRRK